MLRFLLIAWVSLLILGAGAPAQDLLPDDTQGNVGGLLTELETDLGSTWWDKEWKYRRKVVVRDPQVTLARGKNVSLPGPDPLLTANLGLCRRDGADFRVVSHRGKVLPGGALNPGVDDGSGRIWFRVPRDNVSVPMTLWVYYGHARASPAAGPAPDLEPALPLLEAQVGEEESQPSPSGGAGAEQGQTSRVAAFFDSFIVVEFEDFVAPDGRLAVAHAKYERPHMFGIDRPGASGGTYVAPEIPWRPEPMKGPVEAFHKVDIPRAGRWRMHVRYKVTDYYPMSHRIQRGKPQIPMGDFTVTVDGRPFQAGTDHQRGASYRWQGFDVDLPQGQVNLALRVEKVAGPDCILFTQDTAYVPDCRDWNGPVWMRFKVVDQQVPPHFIELFCVHTPWSSHGPQGDTQAVAMADRLVPRLADAAELQGKAENLLKPGQWTLWMPAVHSRGILWWSVAHVLRQFGPRRVPIAGVNVEFQFATRPHQARAFRAGIESVGGDGALQIIMPSSLDWQAVNSHTWSFGQWADQRFKLVQKAGFDGSVNPHPFITGFMASAWSERELDQTLQTAAWLGFNTFSVHGHASLPGLLSKHGLPHQTVAHHWYPKFDWTDAPAKPAAGRTHEQAVVEFLRAMADRTYGRSVTDGRFERRHAKLIIMGDEVGPAVHAAYVNLVPLLKGFFHEYLQAQGLTPDFFGRSDWSQIDALHYDTLGSRTVAALKSIDPGYETDTERQTRERDRELLDAAMGGQPRGEGAVGGDAAPGEGGSLPPPPGNQLQQDMEAEETRASAGYVSEKAVEGSLHEKRLWHWSQKFREYYTRHFYREATRAIQEAAARGELAHAPFASPNFQAMPVHKGRMWDGALNLFDLGRHRALGAMQVEDWSWNPYKVAFGMLILRGATREHGQPIGGLIVGGSPLQRYVADLAMGARSVFSYLYGPLRTIGPPWAEHEPTIEQFGRIHRWLDRLREDLTACDLRPARAAILFSNLTEMNHRFYPHHIWERQAIFAALADEGLPVEVLSEEELIDNPASLSRYKVIYVGDPHVHSQAQQRILDWVEQGGTLWSFYAGLSRQEYDQPSTILDPVFGLKSRREPPLGSTPGRDGPHRIEVSDGEPFQAVRLEGLIGKPVYELAGGEAVAAFEDGSPAIVRHAFGRGQAWLLGFSSRQAVTAYDRSRPELPDSPARRRLAAAACTIAGIEPPVTSSYPRLLRFIHDGPDRSVLYVIACLDRPMPDLNLRVKLPRPAASAITADGKDLPVRMDGDVAQIVLNLPQDECQIVVFRYR